MSYSKLTKHPSVKTPGIYPDVEDNKQIGLDTDDLQELSLGNWNSHYKGNKLLLSGDLLKELQSTAGVNVRVRTSPPKHGSRVVVWRYKKGTETLNDAIPRRGITLAQGPIRDYLADWGYELGQQPNSGNDVMGNIVSRFQRTKFIYETFYGGVTINVGDKQGSLFLNLGQLTPEGMVNDYDFINFDPDNLNKNLLLNFDDDSGILKQREDDDSDIVLVLSENSQAKLDNQVLIREISDEERDVWGGGAPERGNDQDFTHELIVLTDFDIQSPLIQQETTQSIELLEILDKPYILAHGTGYDLGGTYFTDQEFAYDDSVFQQLRNDPDFPVLNQYNSDSSILDIPSAITLRGLPFRIYRGPDAGTNHPFKAKNLEYATQRNADIQAYNETAEANNLPYNFTIQSDTPNGEFSNSGFGYYHSENGFEADIKTVSWRAGWQTEVDFKWPSELEFVNHATVAMGNRDRMPQRPGYSGQTYKDILELSQIFPGQQIIEAFTNHLELLGYPEFESNFVIDDSAYVENLETFDTPVDFIVNAKTNNNNNLLYFDRVNDSIEYTDTSYPLEVNINLELYNKPDFINDFIELDELRREVVLAAFLADENIVRSYLNTVIEIPRQAQNPEECYYKYQVVQWGDEKQLLTDDQIKDSFFFKFYDSEDYPKPEDYFYKKYQQAQLVNSVPIQTNIKHTYNTPGIKNLKIVVYRYTKDTAFILQTYLVSKNIVVNDGILKSQDFNIFGSNDFKFLPISNNQAIIGGFDIESDYNNSVEKLVKDNLFLKEEFLDRVSAKDYINRFNNGFLGETPGQLNLGQMRVFNKPKDIYDFIGGNKLEWINQNSGSLPLNSLATDIFIDDEDCTIDLNPSNFNYSVLNNQVGLSSIGVLVGDYKLKQSEGESVVKEGIPKLPELDDTKDRQAF